MSDAALTAIPVKTTDDRWELRVTAADGERSTYGPFDSEASALRLVDQQLWRGQWNADDRGVPDDLWAESGTSNIDVDWLRSIVADNRLSGRETVEFSVLQPDGTRRVLKPTELSPMWVDGKTVLVFTLTD